MKKIFLSLLFLPLFFLSAQLASADHSVDFTISGTSSFDASNNKPHSNTYVISTRLPYFTPAPADNILGSCSLIDNGTGNSIDTNETLYQPAIGGYGVVVNTNIPSASYPTGWTFSSTYHLLCSTIDPSFTSLINSNDFHFAVNPTIVHVDQNFNLINVYFLPHYNDYPDPFAETGLFAEFGWFDNLTGTSCENNVEYNGQDVSVCHFDLYGNPNLATSDVVHFSFGGQFSDSTSYSVASNAFHVTSIQPHVSLPGNVMLAEGTTYSASGSSTNISPIETSLSAVVDYGDGSGSQPLTLDGTNFSLSHVYSSPGIFTLSACVTESLQNTGPSSGCANSIVTVIAPPQVNQLLGGTIVQGGTYSENGSFTDSNQNVTSWTATVDYGDGSGSIPLNLSGTNFVLSHQYTNAGTYTVTVSVTDNQGATGTGTAVIIVNNPPPTLLTPVADSYIKQGNPNENEGASTFLRLQNTGNDRALIKFDESQIQAAVGSSQNYTASLQFTITGNGNNWGNTGRAIELHRLTKNWSEGNGFIDGNSPANRGTGAGTTWACATDSNIHNHNDDCSGVTAWNMTISSLWPFASAVTASTTISNNQTGTVSFDVTSDVQSFLNGNNQNYGWLLKKANESVNGRVEFGSKESSSAPQLIITKN